MIETLISFSGFIPAVLFFIALIMGFKLTKSLYGRRFTLAFPYLMIGIVLILGMQVILIMERFLPLSEDSTPFLFSLNLNSLQIMAGVFFLLALYQIYQSRFATEGFMVSKAPAKETKTFKRGKK